MSQEHGHALNPDMVCQDKHASSASTSDLSPEKCHGAVSHSIDTSIGLDMFTPTCPTPVATNFSPLKTPPANKSHTSHATLPRPKALTYSSNFQRPDDTFGSHAELKSEEPIIGVPAKAESVNDPDVPLPGGHSGHSDQFCGEPASVEDLWEFAQEILHDDFSPNNTANNPTMPSRTRAPRALSSLPLHVERSIRSRYHRKELVPSQSFLPLPCSKVGQRSPGSYYGLEQRLVEGRHGVLQRLCPIWTRGRKNEAKYTDAQNRIFEFVTDYNCKCPGCPYGLSVVRVNGGLVLMQKTEI